MQETRTESYVVIFRTWRKDPKTGEKIYARDFGKKAWPIWIKIKKK